MWIDQSDGFRTTIGERTQVMIATFPINVVYDGTDRAQVAGLDDIVSGIVDAVAAVPGAEVARVAPSAESIRTSRTGGRCASSRSTTRSLPPPSACPPLS